MFKNFKYNSPASGITDEALWPFLGRYFEWVVLKPVDGFFQKTEPVLFFGFFRFCSQAARNSAASARTLDRSYFFPTLFELPPSLCAILQFTKQFRINAESRHPPCIQAHGRSIRSFLTHLTNVSARRLELNKIIFRRIAPTLEVSIQRLKKAEMRMVTPKYGSKPT